jgi:integration host factor subunit alpha
LTRADLMDVVSERIGRSRRACAAVVEATLAVIKEALQNGEPAKIVAFGRFTVRQKSARRGRNPKTGHPIIITPRKVLSFKASQSLRDVVNTGEPS